MKHVSNCIAAPRGLEVQIQEPECQDVRTPHSLGNFGGLRAVVWGLEGVWGFYGFLGFVGLMGFAAFLLNTALLARQKEQPLVCCRTTNSCRFPHTPDTETPTNPLILVSRLQHPTQGELRAQWIHTWLRYLTSVVAKSKYSQQTKGLITACRV